MKNIYYQLLLFIVLMGTASCSDGGFLDETVTTDLDYKKIFSDSTYTEGFLNEAYRQIGFSTRANRFSKDGETFGGLQTASDEAEYRTSAKITTDVQFATGTVNPVIITDDAWKICYENIRRINVFCRGVENSPMAENRKKQLKGEARFLRAWYYFNLLQHYGGVPLIGDSIYTGEDKMRDTRDTYADCVDYIVRECNMAYESLPYCPTGKEYGRIGGGACKALIARVKLLAASPLFNGNSDMSDGTCPPELIGYPQADPERWKEAMEAAYAVLSSGYYKLYEQDVDPKNNNEPDPGHGFYAIFMGSEEKYRPYAYCGTILEEVKKHDRNRESWFQPPSRGVSQSAGFIYQGLVDAFPMKNGKTITDPESGYNPQNPYSNRDPRLKNTVLYDQVKLQDGYNPPAPVNLYINADGTSSGQDAVYTGTPTGYYINKMINRYLANNTVHGGPQGRPLIRYAEIALGYAEAMNEYALATSGESAIVPENEATYTVLTSIRKRAGIDPGKENRYGLKGDMTRLEMRETIRLERRIELAIEGYRFWDVRRWKIAEQTDNGLMTGMEVRLKNTADKTQKGYKTFNVRQRTFRKAMYFWPIPYEETIKLPNLIQNPFYNL